jgi:hypothetical protein
MIVGTLRFLPSPDRHDQALEILRSIYAGTRGADAFFEKRRIVGNGLGC